MSTPHRLTLAALAAAVLACSVASAPAQEAHPSSSAEEGSDASSMSPRQLSEQRWREQAYGLSLRLPLDTRTRSQTADDYLLRLADEGGRFTMSVAVKRSRSRLKIKEVADSAIEQIFSVQGTSEVLDRHMTPVGGRPAAILYVRAPQPVGSDILLGQALVQLDPRTFAVLEVRCDIADAKPVRVTFEAMLETMEITDPKLINRQRRDALSRSQRWQRELSPDEMHAALVEEQTYRLTEAEGEIGYMRVRQKQAEREKMPGVEVEVQTRVSSGGSYYDTLATFFLADDQSAERWEIKTTRRPPGAATRINERAASENQTRTYVETGIRNGKKISIFLDGPWGHKKRRFEAPALGYLSQVESWLLPQLLPIARPATYGFYSYDSERGKLTYRTAEIVPTLSGFTLKTQLRPNAPTFKATYSTDRKLIEKQLGHERTQQPASPAMIQHAWRNH